MTNEEKVAKTWFDSLNKGDFATAMGCLSDDIEWVNISPVEGVSDIIPWIGTARGTKEVMAAFASRDAHITLERFESTGLVVQGDEACGTIHEVSVVKSTDKRFDITFATWLKIKDGKIVRWQSFCDPSAIIAAFRGDLSAEIINAVEQDDVAQCEKWLRLGASPNTRSSQNGLTVLMTAVCHGNLEMTQRLVDAGADVLTTDSHTGATPLHKACQGGNTEVVRLLLDKGAFIDAVTPTMGHTPIMDALWYKWEAIVDLLVQRGANLQLGTHYGFTMDDHLRFELNVNQGEAKKAFQKMADIVEAGRERNRHQIEAQRVMTATNAGDLEGVKTAITQGESVNTVYPHINSFLDGHTPLIVAARDGHTEIVGELLAAGAEVRVADWVFKGAPMHKATYNGNATILRLLVDQPNIDLDVQGAINGYTPLHDALWHGFEECAEILINARARLDLRGHDGKTVLDLSRRVLGDHHRITQMIETKQQR